MINHKTSSQWAQESLSCFLRGKTFGVNKTKSTACLNESFPPALHQKQKWIKLVEGTYWYVCIIIMKLVWAVFFLIHKTNILIFKLTSYCHSFRLCFWPSASTAACPSVFGRLCTLCLLWFLVFFAENSCLLHLEKSLIRAAKVNKTCTIRQKSEKLWKSSRNKK